MKRRLILALAFCLCAFLSQNKADAQFMISAGYDRMQYVLDGSNSGNPFDGFSAEIGYTARFAKGVLGVNFGVGYQFNTRRDESFSMGSLDTEVSSQEQYVEVPLRFMVDIPVSKMGIVLYGGGYAAYGLSGIRTYEFTLGEDGSGDISYDYFNAKLDSDEIIPESIVRIINDRIGESKYDKLEFGVQAGGGFRIGNNVLLHGLYRWGLGNRNAAKDDSILRRNGFSVKISFLF